MSQVPDYCAPASTILTVLHIRNPLVQGQPEVGTRPANVGMTKCGLAMVSADLWQLVDLLPGDRICPRCAGQPAEEQGALL